MGANESKPTETDMNKSTPREDTIDVVMRNLATLNSGSGTYTRSFCEMIFNFNSHPNCMAKAMCTDPLSGRERNLNTESMRGFCETALGPNSATSSALFLAVFLSRDDELRLADPKPILDLLTCSYECFLSSIQIVLPKEPERKSTEITFLKKCSQAIYSGATRVGESEPTVGAVKTFLTKRVEWHPEETIHNYCRDVLRRYESSYNYASTFPRALTYTSIDDLKRAVPALKIPSLTIDFLWALSAILPPIYQPALSADSTAQRKLNEAIGGPTPAVSFPGFLSWQPLYDSAEHGFSFNRFEHNAFSYKQPTLAIVATEDGSSSISDGEKTRTFVAAVDSEWRQSTNAWGGADCVFVAADRLKVTRSTGGMCYCNDTMRSAPRAITFRSSSAPGAPPLLSLDTDFSSVKYDNMELPNGLRALFVLGCGDTEYLEKQRQQKLWETRDAEKQKNKNLRAGSNADWKSSADRTLLDMAGVSRGNYARDAGIEH